MKIFILEDNNQRIEAFLAASTGLDVTIATNLSDAKRQWNPPYDVIFLDHDLGGKYMVDSAEEETGMTFAVWMPERPAAHDVRVVVHSYNPYGAHLMGDELNRKGYSVVQQPFGDRILFWLKSLAHVNAPSPDAASHSPVSPV